MDTLRQAEMECQSGQELMLLGVVATGAIKGRLLAMSLQQRFRNASDANTEITYTFPLPWGAILMGVDVELNGQRLYGEVAARNTARARYEEAMSEGNSSIMLERNSDQSYTLELGNLMAREECSITIRYAQVLALDHGQIRMMLPTTIAPRYGNPLTQSGLAPHQTTATDITAEYPFDIELTLHGDLASANVASPSHRTGYQPNGGELLIRLAQKGALDRDFILTISDLHNRSSAIACSDMCEPGQTALMANFSPDLGTASELPVAVKILVDCSGSMAGDSIEAARSAMREIVEGLQSEDRFSLSRFGTTVEHRSRGMWGGTAQAKASAQRWVNGVDADLGGTEMAGALLSTIAISHIGQSDILLITDGEIHGIDEVIDVAKQSKHRVFIVAIGASPAEVHLRRLATATSGACDFVAPGEDVGPAVLRMFNRLRARQASKLRVEWPACVHVRWAQSAPASAFPNDAIAVSAFVGEFPAQVEALTVRLWGRLDNSVAEQVLGEALVEREQSSANTLSRVNAFAQYQEEVTAKQPAQADTVQVKAQELAVKYQLVTDETNFILVHVRDADQQAREMPTAHKVPQMVPAGWGGTGAVVAASMAPDIQFSISPAEVTKPASSRMLFSKNAPLAQLDSHSYDAAPSVWRTSRSSVAQRTSMSDATDLDAFEIPAFLRKQAAGGPQYKRCQSATEAGITPSEFAQWLEMRAPSLWPKTYQELLDIGLSMSLCEWLEFEVGSGQSESAVVQAFITVIQSMQLDGDASATKGPKLGVPNAVEEGTVVADIRAALAAIEPGGWPQSVVNFPAESLV